LHGVGFFIGSENYSAQKIMVGGKSYGFMQEPIQARVGYFYWEVNQEKFSEDDLKFE